MSWRIYFLLFVVVCPLQDLSYVIVVFVGEIFRTVGLDGWLDCLSARMDLLFVLPRWIKMPKEIQRGKQEGKKMANSWRTQNYKGECRLCAMCLTF